MRTLVYFEHNSKLAKSLKLQMFFSDMFYYYRRSASGLFATHNVKFFSLNKNFSSFFKYCLKFCQRKQKNRIQRNQFFVILETEFLLLH